MKKCLFNRIRNIKDKAYGNGYFSGIQEGVAQEKAVQYELKRQYKNKIRHYLLSSHDDIQEYHISSAVEKLLDELIKHHLLKNLHYRVTARKIDSSMNHSESKSLRMYLDIHK